jgi:hypothetical protein
MLFVMAGPLKRTGFRASPEDAAFYRRFHDYALSSLRKGVSREDLLRDLQARGVPDKTAERIVVAVEQEHALAVAAPGGVPKGKGWIIGVALLVVFGSSAVYIATQMAEDKTLKLKYLLPAMIVALVLTGIVVSRLLLKTRGLHDLPPPPDKPT